MKYQMLGKSGITVSQVAFGAWGLGGGNVWSGMSFDAEYVRDLLSYAFDCGINYIDTAPVYGIGTSERILGKALEGMRDRFVLQSKCSLNWRGTGRFEYERDGYNVMRDHHAEAVRKDVEESLERLNTDYLDSLVVHRISKDVPVEETMGELLKMKQEGKIRAILISNSRPEDFLAYAQCGETDGVQEKFSLLSSENSDYFETLKKHKAIFQVYGSLEQGILGNPKVLADRFGAGDIRSSSKWVREPYRAKLLEMYSSMEDICEKYGCSFANLMQAWILKQYDLISLLTGFRRRETIADTCRVFDIALSDKDAEYMERLAQKVRNAEQQKV
ncbi:MAG: aldo/keto reductase [Solobacterium sp.]|nr:aldo/keto reductase [Solobacterium sp.]